MAQRAAEDIALPRALIDAFSLPGFMFSLRNGPENINRSILLCTFLFRKTPQLTNYR